MAHRSLGKGRRQDGDLESTADLLIRIRGGDARAREILIRRYMGVLRRLAHGRVPRRSRGLVETDDLVLLTLEASLNHIERFEPRREGAFLAFLRQILFNKIRDEGRRAGAAPEQEGLPEDLPGGAPSPLELRIGREKLEAYERALQRLTETQREAVVMRLEMGYTYEEIAQAIESPSPNAARMLIGRALVRMAEEMRAHRSEP